MTTTIVEAPRFDIAVTESLDYRREPRYLVRYGLEVKRRDTIEDALIEFGQCFNHALACESIELEFIV